MNQYINQIDFILFAFAFLITFKVAVFLRDRHFKKDNPARNYFVPALLIKIVGSVAFAVVYQFYYGYGDTFRFYEMGLFFTRIVKNDPTEFLNVYLLGGDDYFVGKSYIYNFDYLFNHTNSNIIVSRFSSFIGLFTFNNYLFTTIGFSIISFSGLWKLFRMFTTIYPHLAKQLAWCILFVPSVIFWGSGLLKDSLTLGALGWMTFSCWSLFFLKKRIVSSLFGMMFCLLILFQVKAYILLTFLPPLLIWVGAQYYQKVNNRYLRLLLWPIFIAVIVFVAFQAADLIAKENKQLTLETITNTALTTSYGMQQIEAGSTYSLGKIAPSMEDLILKVPIALVTTLFRPFVWEAKNIVMLVSALESLLILLTTIWVLLKAGLFRTIKVIFSHSIVFFSLFFSLIFSVGVAISSGNFGTLVRYKLPAMPFYLVSLLLIVYYSGKFVPANTSGIQRRSLKKIRPKVSLAR